MTAQLGFDPPLGSWIELARPKVGPRCVNSRPRGDRLSGSEAGRAGRLFARSALRQEEDADA